MIKSSVWFPLKKEAERETLRLYFFPFAGGAAHAYRPFLAHLPATVSGHILELPGRGTRFPERAIDTWPAITDALCEAVVPPADDVPFAFLGHSFGAKLAHAVAVRCGETGARLPAHLFLSGSSCPMKPRPNPRGAWPTPELVAELRRMGGTPEEVLGDPDFLELFLPSMRADLTLNDTYDASKAAPLPVPITGFYGTADAEADGDAVQKWETRTTEPFTAIPIQGRHFFVLERAADVLRYALARIRTAGAATAP